MYLFLIIAILFTLVLLQLDSTNETSENGNNTTEIILRGVRKYIYVDEIRNEGNFHKLKSPIATPIRRCNVASAWNRLNDI